MNLMLLLAQVAPALADSIAGANPVLTPVAAPDEMNLWSMAVKGGWIMVVLGVLSVVCFYILFERNYVIRKAGKEDPMFMDKIKDYILGGEIKAAIAYCRSVNTPSARMIEKGISRLGRPMNDVQAAIENVGNIEVATSILPTFSMAACTSFIGRPKRLMPFSIIRAEGVLTLRQ